MKNLIQQGNKKIGRKKGEKNKMKNIKTIVGTTIIGLLMIGCLMPTALADSTNVTVTWIIPADMSISVTFPTGQGKIAFEPGSKTFTEQHAKSQTGATAGMNVDNTGNTAVQINFTFQGAWYDAGITYFNCSINDNTNASKLYWTNSNETANHTAVASLGTTADEDFWFWSTGTDCLESAELEDEETFIVYYTNA